MENFSKLLKKYKEKVTNAHCRNDVAEVRKTVPKTSKTTLRIIFFRFEIRDMIFLTDACTLTEQSLNCNDQIRISLSWRENFC